MTVHFFSPHIHPDGAHEILCFHQVFYSLFFLLIQVLFTYATPVQVLHVDIKESVCVQKWTQAIKGKIVLLFFLLVLTEPSGGRCQK